MKKIILLDGRSIPVTDKLLESLAPGRLRGRGVFETMRARNGTIFYLDEHLRRLSRGLRILRLPCPCPIRDFREQLARAVAARPLRNARLRLTVWRSGGGTHWAIVVVESRSLPAKKYQQGFAAQLVSFRRKLNGDRPYVKSLQYQAYLRAYERALRRGFDEALLISGKGTLLEGSRSNVFFFRKGVLFTPALRCGCLRGVTRQAVIRLARARGWKVREAEVDSGQILQAEEAFLTNAVRGLMPLTRIDDRMISRGRMGPLTRSLIKDYRRIEQRQVVRWP